MTATDIEIALSQYLGIRTSMLVTNVSWGLWVHECDLLRVMDSRWAHEYEIKVSKADIIADQHKRHKHKNCKIRSLTFAIPEHLKDCIEHIPERAGIILVDARKCCKLVRKAVLDKDARKLTEKEYLKVGKLASMRLWGMKMTIANLINMPLRKGMVKR